MANDDLRILTRNDIDRLERIERDIQEKLEFLSLCFKLPTVINITDISKRLKISRTQLIGKQAYLLPNHGRKSDFPDGPMRWTISTWTDWNARPVEERKKEFLAVLDSERRRARR